jgi:hypothetical protein
MEDLNATGHMADVMPDDPISKTQPAIAGSASAARSRPIGTSKSFVGFTTGFTNLLIVSPFAEGTYWFLQSPLIYEDSASNTVTVPVNFVTDFASIPRILWSLLPKWDGYGLPSVVHDYLYWERKGRTRRNVDQLMLSAMKDQHVEAFRRCLIYTALRLFGGCAWSKNAKRKAAGQLGYVLSDKPPPQPTESWADYKQRVGHPDP